MAPVSKEPELNLVAFLLVAMQLCVVCDSCSLSLGLELSSKEQQILKFEHDTLEIICALSDCASRSSKDLAFRFNYNATTYENIEDDAVSYINDTHAKLVYRGLRYNDNLYHLECYDRTNAIKESKYVTLFVKERHPRPRIDSVVIDNWDTLRFNWSVTLDRSVYRTNFRAWYKDSFAKNYQACPDFNNTSCKINNPFDIVSRESVFHLFVNGSNDAGEIISSEPRYIQLLNYVKPGKVRNISVNKELAEHNRSAPLILVFKPPKMEKSISYSVVVSCNNGAFVYKPPEFTPEGEYEMKSEVKEKLYGLPFFTNCTLSIKAITSSKSGFWGDTETYSFSTLESVPIRAPDIVRSSSFEVRRKEDNLMDVLVYFQPLSAESARGIVDGYRVQITDNGASKKTELSTESEDLKNYPFMIKLENLSRDKEYRVTIDAKTRKGFNESLELPVLLVPKQSEALPTTTVFFVVRINATVVELLWNVTGGPVSNYYLFWCKWRKQAGQHCETPINWKKLPAGDRNHVLSISENSDVDNYKFGIAAEKNNRSRGINWSNCTYHFDSVSDPPELAVVSVSFDEALIALRPQLCSVKSRGYVKHFKIYYCKIRSKTEHKCLDSISTMTLERSTDQFPLKGLSSDQMYMISASSVTDFGLSVNSTIEVMTETGPLSSGIISAIVICSIIAFVLVFMGIWAFYKLSRNSCKRLKELYEVHIVTPSSDPKITRVADQEITSLRPDYQNYPDVTEADDLLMSSTSTSGIQTVDISMPESIRPLMPDERCLPAIVKDNTEIGISEIDNMPSVSILPPASGAQKPSTSLDSRRILPEINEKPTKPVKPIEVIKPVKPMSSESPVNQVYPAPRPGYTKCRDVSALIHPPPLTIAACIQDESSFFLEKQLAAKMEGVGDVLNADKKVSDAGDGYSTTRVRSAPASGVNSGGMTCSDDLDDDEEALNSYGVDDSLIVSGQDSESVLDL